MGRHHGFIAAPDVEAASAAGVKVPEIPAEPPPGAKPYAGPGRPEGF
jgi:hypothetical protein